MPLGTTGAAGGSSSAIRAGAAFVELIGKDRLTPTLNAIQKRMQSFGSFMSKIGGASIKAGAALLAPVAALMHGALAKSRTGEFGADAQNTAARFDAAWMKAIDALQRATIPILELLVPALETLSRVIQQNAGIVQLVAGVGAGLIVLGVALKTLGVAVSVASLSITGLKVVMTVFSAAMAAVQALISLAAAGPLGLIAAAAIAATTALVGWKVAAADWGGLLNNLKATAATTFGGMLDAFKAGNLELVWKVALAGLKLAWHDVVEFMKATLRSILKSFAEIPLAVKLLAPPLALLSAVADDLSNRDALKPDNTARQSLEADLARLRKQAAEEAGRTSTAPVLRNAIDASRGLFSSPNFRNALGYGSDVKMLDLGRAQLAMAERANEYLSVIAENSREVYT